MKSATTAQETLKQIYANRSLSSVYSIPRKQSGSGCCLEEVKEHGREWREITKIVQQSVVDKNTMARWKIDRMQLCVNTTLEERFIKKRQKMKEDGRSTKELMEQHAFHVLSHGKARYVCQSESGLGVCHGSSVFSNILGRSDMGVHLRRNADIALKVAERCSYTQTALVVFKIIPGRMKSIPTSFKPMADAIEPTPNFDCHVSNRLPTTTQKESHQMANSGIYLYEYDDSCRPSKAPRQILPYAVVSCTLVSPPKVCVTSIVSVTDISSSDTDGPGSDMDIVDDSADAEEVEAKKAESSSTSVSIEVAKEKQSSERSKKLSVEDIQGCNLGPSSKSETGVFLRPAPISGGNKISQTKNHRTVPTSQGTRRHTFLQPATFQYGNKSQTSDQSTVSASDSASTSSQRLKSMAAGFFAKLKDPRFQRGLRGNELRASCGARGSTNKPEHKPDIPHNAQEARLKAKTKMRQAEHSRWQEMKKTSSDVLSGETARRQEEEMPVGYCSKQRSTKCSTSSKSLTVDKSALKHTGGIKKRKPRTRGRGKMKKQHVLLATEIKIPHGIGQTSAGIQKEKKPEDKVKETKTHSRQKIQDGKLSAFDGQLKQTRHTDDNKQSASVSNPDEQPCEELNRGSDTPVKELLSGKVNDSDSEHTEMSSVLQSLDQTLDLLTPSTVALSSSEMSDSTSEETLCRAHKVTKTELVETEENVAAHEEGSKCLEEVMDMPEKNSSMFQAAQIDWERNKVSSGNMSPTEISVKLEVDLEEDTCRMQGTDGTNNEEESTAGLQALGSKNPPEDSSSKRTMKQEAADATDPTCPNSGVKADVSEENIMESKTCDEETPFGDNSSMLVIDQVFSLAGNGTSQALAEKQEEKYIPEDTVVQATGTHNGLPDSQIGEPPGHNQNSLPVSDAIGLDSKAESLGRNTTRPFVRTTSFGVARPQTNGTRVCENSTSATFGQTGATVTAGVRGEQVCQTSYQSQSCTTWQTKEDNVLESLLMGALNTLELGVQKLQANSDCPQLVVAVRTAATIAIRTSATLLELAVQEVRDHMSRKTDQMLGGMFQQPPLDCRKLESLISGTMNTLKMRSDNVDDSCSMQSAFRTALTLLELALDIVWIRSHPRGNTVGPPQLYNYPQAQGDSMSSEAHHLMECQSNVFSSQWKESERQAQTQWPNKNESTQQAKVDHEVFSMEKQEEHESRHSQLATGGTSDVRARAKPITPPPLPPPLPTFLSLPPQQLFTVSSPSLPSHNAAELGVDHCSNVIGTSGKRGDSEPERAVVGNKQMSGSLQTKTLDTGKHATSKVEGSCEDKEVTQSFSVNAQNMTVDHDVKNCLEVDLEAGIGESYSWTLAEESAKRKDRTPMQCDEAMPMEKASTEQEGEKTDKEEMSSLKMKAAFPFEDTAATATSEFAISQETDDMKPILCDPEKSKIQEEMEPCAENCSTTSPGQIARGMKDSNAKLTILRLPRKMKRKMKRRMRMKGIIIQNQLGGRQENDGSTDSKYEPPQSHVLQKDVPPCLPTFPSLPPEQLFIIPRRSVSSLSLELGVDHCSNLIGTSGKCGDSEPERAVVGNKQMSGSLQTRTLHTGKHKTSKVEGSCVSARNMTVDHNVKNDGSTDSKYEPSKSHALQKGVLSHLADDNMEQLADDVPAFTNDGDHEFYSICNDSRMSSALLSTSVNSLSSPDSFLCNKETVAENTASKGASRPFSCFASLSKGEITDVESTCTFSGKLAANISPTLGNKLAMAAELSTKLSCPKMLINGEHSTASPVREKTAQECGRQKEKEAYERARKRWTRLFKSLVHQEAKNKTGREVKAEEQQKLRHIDSCSATVQDSELETKAEQKEQNTSGESVAAISHEAGNSVLCGANEGPIPTNCCKDGGSSTNLCESELYKTFGMKRSQDNAQGGEGQMLHNQQKPASSESAADRICSPLYNAIHMSQDSKLYEAPFDFDMVLSCARSCHAQEMFQCIADRMKKVSAEIEHFQQGIAHLELNKHSFDGVYLQKDQHKLLLRAGTIHLSEISTELEMLQATKAYLSNIRRKETGLKEAKTPLKDVSSIVHEEDFAPPEERKPDTIRNILLRQLDMKKGQVKALHESLRSYQHINGNNIEFVRMLLRSQIHSHGCDIERLEDVLKDEKPSVKVIPDKTKISEVQERQAKCQDLLRTLVKDSSPDHAKIEWCKMKCGKYHSILLYEGDKCFLWEHRNHSKSRSSAVNDKTKQPVSREMSPAEAQNYSSLKTMKRQYDAVGKQHQGENDQSSKKRKTVKKGLDQVTSKGHNNPGADGTAVETSAGCLGASPQEKPTEKGQSSCSQARTDRLEQKRPKLVSTENDCKTQKPSATRVPSPCDLHEQQPSVTTKSSTEKDYRTQKPLATRVPSPCDLHQQQPRVTVESSKSLRVTIFNPAANGQAEDAVGHSPKAGQDGSRESIRRTESVSYQDVSKKEAESVASAVSSSIDTVWDSSPQEWTTFAGTKVKGIWAKYPLGSEGAIKVKTADSKSTLTHLSKRTVPSLSRQATAPGVHSTSRTVDKRSFIPQCRNKYSAVPYTYPVRNTPPRQVQYPTSHLQPRVNWWSQGPNVLQRPMFVPRNMFGFPNRQQMFPNRWQTN